MSVFYMECNGLTKADLELFARSRQVRCKVLEDGKDAAVIALDPYTTSETEWDQCIRRHVLRCLLDANDKESF